MPRGARSLGPKSVVAQTQWMSDEQAQKLAEDKGNRVFRYSDPRHVTALPAEVVYRVVKNRRGFVERIVDENPAITQEQIKALLIDDEKRTKGDDRDVLRRFREDMPTIFEWMTKPTIGEQEMTKIYELILAMAKKQKGLIQMTDEEMQVYIINRNKRDPTPEEAEKIARGQAYSLDGMPNARAPPGQQAPAFATPFARAAAQSQMGASGQAAAGPLFPGQGAGTR